MPAKLAIVTGTSRGIGTAVARMLVERDWTVLGLARGKAPIVHNAYQHKQCDLADYVTYFAELPSVIEPLIASQPWRRVGLVNNAALVGHLGRTSQLDLSDWSAVQAANLTAPMVLTTMIDRQCGPDVAIRVVNLSSGVAVQAFPGMAAYSTSKAALRMGGMIIAKEWESNVPGAHRNDAAILSYEPGVVDTAMQTDARSRSKQDFPWVRMFTDFHEQGALVKPELPAADIVAFLESDRQPYFSERRLKS